jgi:hypothetical protein
MRAKPPGLAIKCSPKARMGTVGGEGYLKSLKSFARETAGRAHFFSRKFREGGIGDSNL